MRALVASVLFCLLGVSACRHLPGTGADGGPDSCDYAGKRYREGDSFPDADGCNTCFCEAGGGVACTLALCVDPAAQVCSYAGQRFTIGASFPAADGCNTCFCPPSGQVGCTQKACLDEGPID
jgi:Pacifastin inhibitor (LCMII)